MLASVAAGASAILNNPALAGFDVAWGVGNYRDFPSTAASTTRTRSPTRSRPRQPCRTADAAISAWVAGEGADGPRASSTPSTRSRRPGDRVADGRQADPGVVRRRSGPRPDPHRAVRAGRGVTEASATADLTGADITVVAVSTTTGVRAALDDDPTRIRRSTTRRRPARVRAGQATRITAATGGSHTSGVNPGDIVVDARAAHRRGGDVDRLGRSCRPGAPRSSSSRSRRPSYGPLPGDEEHVLTFEVTWIGEGLPGSSRRSSPARSTSSPTTSSSRRSGCASRCRRAATTTASR